MECIDCHTSREIMGDGFRPRRPEAPGAPRPRVVAAERDRHSDSEDDNTDDDKP